MNTAKSFEKGQTVTITRGHYGKGETGIVAAVLGSDLYLVNLPNGFRRSFKATSLKAA
jgi:hypothetical protein